MLNKKWNKVFITQHIVIFLWYVTVYMRHLKIVTTKILTSHGL